MRKFNKLYTMTTTYVQLHCGPPGWYKVKEIHETKYWIQLEGIGGCFQSGHISKFTNNPIAKAKGKEV